MQDILFRFRQICENRYELPKQLKSESQKRVFGYFCTYFPAELVHAAGMLPLRIMGDKRKGSYTEAHMPSIGCSFIRTALDLGLSGTLDYLDGVIFSHTCDSMKVLSDIWHENFKDKFVDNILFPVKLDGHYSYQFLVKELKSFKNRLEEYLGISIEKDRLWESIEVYERNRELLKEVYFWNQENPGILRGSDILNMVISSMVIPKEEHNKLLQELISHLKQNKLPQRETQGLARVILAGNICAFPEIVDAIEDSNALVVNDDLCTGSRYFVDRSNHTPDIEKNGDPLAYIARKYLGKSPCPTKYVPGFSREQALLDMVKESKADGVVFLMLRSCDICFFDYPLLKKALDKEGYPSLFIEYEQQDESFGRVRTRVEAFVETIVGIVEGILT